MRKDRLELSAVVTALRAEINKSWSKGQSDAVGFEAGPIEVELTTEIEIVEVEGKFSANFLVLGMEAGGGRTRTNTQKITFSITPKDRKNPTKPLLISGQAAPGEHRPEVSLPED